MKAIYRHELSSYFNGLTAYVFAAFMLLFAGIYMMVYNLKNLVANYEYVPGSMGFVFIVIVPILTMRVIAEERKQKTDQLLYSLPVKMTGIVLGKYLAMLTILIIPTAVMCIYPLILSAFGNVYLPASYSAMIMFFLMGAALLSIGMFISSLTENQAIAAGICFVVMLLNYFGSSLASYLSSTAVSSFIVLMICAVIIALIVWLMTKNSIATLITLVVLAAVLVILYLTNNAMFEGLFPNIIENISLFDRFNDCIGGVFDLKTLVYFVSVSGLFIFLTVQSMEKRRWS